MTESTNTSTPIWKSKKGDVPITEMATIWIKNAINKVESEIKGGQSTPAKEKVLEDLKAEHSTRTDADA